jgi:hypothetical protein
LRRLFCALIAQNQSAPKIQLSKALYDSRKKLIHYVYMVHFYLVFNCSFNSIYMEKKLEDIIIVSSAIDIYDA